MDIAAITQNSQTAGAGKTAGNSAQKEQAALGKEQFLTLLLTQLKNQDPLSPMDNSEFTAQMAQFSSLEQLFNVNDNLSGLKGLTASLNNTQAMTLIGKDIEAAGDAIAVESGKATDISFSLPETGFGVKVNVINSGGEVVNTLYRERLDKGLTAIEWDGRNSNGSAVSPGNYSFTVQAKNSSGGDIEASTFMKGKVTAISIDNGVTHLHVGDRKVLLTDVTKILESKKALGSN